MFPGEVEVPSRHFSLQKYCSTNSVAETDGSVSIVKRPDTTSSLPSSVNVHVASMFSDELSLSNEDKFFASATPWCVGAE